MRKFVISEEVEQQLIGDILTEAFCPSAEKVRQVKEFLDKNKITIQSLSPQEILMLLDDKFPRIITDDADRKKFLEQIVREWWAGTLSDSGVLALNYIK